MIADIDTYNKSQISSYRSICNLLALEIEKVLASDESKIWHGHPVWFIEGNPIVGYAVRKKGVVLLFWSGQSFDEEELVAEGSFKAAEACYQTIDDIDYALLHRWLLKSTQIQWDYKNIVKRKGVLERLK